jgi:hypothetical protein
MGAQVIEVRKEDEIYSLLTLENCCLCRAATPYWYVHKDVACCQACAATATPDMIPSKAEWCAKERALQNPGD